MDHWMIWPGGINGVGWSLLKWSDSSNSLIINTYFVGWVHAQTLRAESFLLLLIKLFTRWVDSNCLSLFIPDHGSWRCQKLFQRCRPEYTLDRSPVHQRTHTPVPLSSSLVFNNKSIIVLYCIELSCIKMHFIHSLCSFAQILVQPSCTNVISSTVVWEAEPRVDLWVHVAAYTFIRWN